MVRREVEALRGVCQGVGDRYGQASSFPLLNFEACKFDEVIWCIFFIQLCDFQRKLTFGNIDFFTFYETIPHIEMVSFT